MLLKIVILLMEKWSHMDKFFNRDMLMKIVILWKNWSHMATFHEFDLIGERCEKKWRFSKKETTYEGVQTFFMGAVFMKIIILLIEN